MMTKYITLFQLSLLIHTFYKYTFDLIIFYNIDLLIFNNFIYFIVLLRWNTQIIQEKEKEKV